MLYETLQTHIYFVEVLHLILNFGVLLSIQYSGVHFGINTLISGNLGGLREYALSIHVNARGSHFMGII